VNLELAEAVAPDRAVIKASGQAPGSAVEATGEMTLAGPAEGPTTMDWSANVAILGTFASVGARLVEGQANRMIKQAFDCMRAKLEA
jgi:carbon monoxide dehydrogenase subunit G